MKRLFIAYIYLLLVANGESLGLNFRQVAYLPTGSYFGGFIKGEDSNRDGRQELFFRGDISLNSRMGIFGYRPYNRYLLEDTTVTRSSPWDVGFLDNDTLYDVVCQARDSTDTTYIRVYEQPSPGAFPTTLAWDWRYEYRGYGISAMYITDLDRDNLREILTADFNIIYVFETRGDNQYIKAFSHTETLSYFGITPYFAVADFDGDGHMEFAYGTYGPSLQNDPTVFVRECTGNDQYQLVWMDTLFASNMADVIACPDLDGDGRPEFMIGSYTSPGGAWTAGVWLYESVGNNQYELIYADSITGLFGIDDIRHSDCGDVDMDGKPELVWTINQDWMVYKSTGNNQFQRVFRAYRDRRHRTTKALIRDMNGNGYPEIIITGDSLLVGAYGETEVWEVETCRLVYPNGGETLYGDSLAVIRWRNVDPFRADSFSLFYSSDSSLTYSPVAHGVPGSDSAYTWTVPKTYSDDCFVMLWAYQNATGWDFSDSHFRIRDGNGVEQGNAFPSPISHLPYRVAPNPFISYATLPGHEKEQFALYDVSGRKVGNYPGSRIGYELSAGIYFLKPEAKGSKPIRLVKLR